MSRFSAAGVKPDAKDDTKTDIQGFALKIIGVPGKKLIDEGTQESNGFDLLLANVPFFLAKDVKEYNEQLSLNSPDIDIFTKGRILFTVLPRLNRAIGMSKTQNPFSDIYSSVSTYQIEQNMVNYRAVPCANQTHMAGPEGATKFRTAMQLSMTQGNGACFELEARKALTPSYLMAEDVTKTWEEHITTALEKVPEAKGNSVFEKTIGPWVSLGQISFPVQTFESEGQMNFCEAMSFNPWRTLPEMRPLGGLNRARKSVYKAVFDTRKADNSWKDIPEPTGTESF